MKNSENKTHYEQKMVDISSGKAKKSGHYSKAKKQKSKKRAGVIIASVAVAVVAVAGAAGFLMYQNGLFGESKASSESTEPEEFKFGENVYVSGVLISGKNMRQAKLALELSKDSFITPVSITVDVNGSDTTLSQDDFTYDFNIDEVLEKVKSDSLNEVSTNTDPSTGRTDYEVSVTVNSESIEKVAGRIATDSYKKATNAYVSKFNPFSDTRFEYTEAVQGQEVDENTLSTKLLNALQSGAGENRVVADVKTVDADITVDKLKNNIVKLASYETYSTNTENGTSNMKVSLAACNGSIIESGAIWSFNECTGDSNLESLGYKSAHVISDGELTDGIGGGICQSSSTIYNAALRANMEIEERYCHKWASSYVPTGLDATIDYPNLDLKLSNPTDYQMFMECKVEGTTLYVAIWGVKSDSYDEIKLENKLGDHSGSNYKVYAWRVYYKNGEEVDREELASSTYDDEYGVVFSEASNDSRANTDIDEDSSSSSSSSSQSQSSSSSSKTESSEKSSESSSKTESSSSKSEEQTSATQSEAES